jgi:polar amino acid transport system permease protein
MDALAAQFFDLSIMAAAWPMVLKGLWMTLALCAAVIPMGLAGGLLAALAALSPRRWLRWPAMALIDLFRALPPLVLLILIYSGLPFAGVRLDPFTAVVIAFLLNNASYYGEIFRAGVESVPPGQVEAARSTGMTQGQTMAWVVLPQAVRNVLPDLASNTVEVVKLTSLASVVSLSEMMHQANMARSVTYNASPIVLAAAIYLALLWPMVRLIGRFERRAAA